MTLAKKGTGQDGETRDRSAMQRGNQAPQVSYLLPTAAPNQSLVFVVRADPDPDVVLTVGNGQCAVLQPGPRRPEIPDLLES
jgi:hypothetical protein